MITININVSADVAAVVGLLEQIMKTQQELAQDLTDLSVKLGAVASEVDKIGTETTALTAMNQDLADKLAAAIAAGGQVTPELEAAVAAAIAQAGVVASKVQAVDNLVPDAPTA